MADAVASNVVFVSGERKDTRTGKERYVVRSADGREFSVWDPNLFGAIQQHLHETVVAEVSSNQDQRGTWWNTVHALPAFGVKAVDTRGQGGGGGGGGTNPSPAAGLDTLPIVERLERIASAMESLLAFAQEVWIDTKTQGAAQVEGGVAQTSGPGPNWPNDEPPDQP